MAPKYKQGIFRPSRPEKYAGDPTRIVYRSGLELRLASWLDTHSSVRKWSSEETIVPYRDPFDSSRVRRYFPDFVVWFTSGRVMMIEVKPDKETRPPSSPVKKTARSEKRMIVESLTYAKNAAKWNAAKKYCETRGWEFKIMTEKEIPNIG